MANPTANELGQLALKLGVLTANRLDEARADLVSTADAAELVRVLERKGYLTPWQSQKLLKGETDGYFLGGYKLLYLISAGSFGRVFRAEDAQTGVIVAIKVLKKQLGSNPRCVQLFEREGKVGQALSHPNIVRIVGVNQDVVTQQYYMVMEFVEGGSLADFIAIRKKLDPAEALRLLEDAATGLAYAHSRGLNHRDIKPTNILIASNGIAKLVDFGLARITDTEACGEQANVERTVDYAGLEKATGVKSGDVRSDIYFLGCVLYEMLTGRKPLAPTKDASTPTQKRRFDSVPPVRRDEVKGPPSLFRLVETMMALKPQQRYQTPAELVDAIRAVRRDVESPEAATTTGPRVVFVVEHNEQVRDAIRDRFKEAGMRVLLAADPNRALERFQQTPYDALVLDAVAAGAEGVRVFRQVCNHADQRGIPLAAILILAENQTGLTEKMALRPSQAVLVRPVTMKQLYGKLMELLPAEN